MAFFDSIFGGAASPADSANDYFNRIPETVRPYYDPFINSGREAEGITNPIYSRMAQNPNDFLNAIMRNYTPSEGYQFMERNMSRKLSNTAAEGGYAGTPHSQMEQGELMRGLLGQDMQQFLQNIMGIQGQGLQGHENRISRGFDASRGLADILGSNLATQGGLAFQDQAQKNKDQNALFNSLLNFAGGAASRLATAGMSGGGGGAGMGGGGSGFASGGFF